MLCQSRRAFLALLTAGLLLLGLTPSLLAAPPGGAAQLTILQLNDVYDIMPVERGTRGGLARVATLQDRIRQENPNTIFVLAGDFLSPSTMSSIFQGSQMVAGLNAVGLDLATFGNHEFDFGPDIARQRMQESRFTWVSANVLDPATGMPFGGAVSFVLRRIGGLRLAVFGLTMPQTRTLSKGAATIKFLDPIEAARDAVSRARHLKADVIVALTHQDMADDRRLAATVPGIDLILGGHEHAPLDARVGRTLILKTGSDARSLGRIDIQVFPRRNGKRVESKWKLIPVTDQIPARPDVAALVRHYEELTAGQLEVVVGATSLPLDTRGTMVRTQESVVGDLIADVLRSAMGADVALVNGGGIRGEAVVPAGPLRRGDVLRILPFANKVVKLGVSGETLRLALENGLSQVENTAGRFPQVSGIRYVFDPRRPPGSRLVSVTVNGQPLDEKAQYTLATFDFLSGGGDGYAMLRSASVLVKPENGPMDSDLLLERLRQGPIAPVPDGRIQRVP